MVTVEPGPKYCSVSFFLKGVLFCRIPSNCSLQTGSSSLSYPSYAFLFHLSLYIRWLHSHRSVFSFSFSGRLAAFNFLKKICLALLQTSEGLVVQIYPSWFPVAWLGLIPSALSAWVCHWKKTIYLLPGVQSCSQSPEPQQPSSVKRGTCLRSCITASCIIGAGDIPNQSAGGAWPRAV